MHKIALAVVLALSITGAASAQELIVGASPMPASPDPATASPAEQPPGSDAQANGDWARKVMTDAAEGKSTDKEQQTAQAACVRNPDRAPHGEVYGSVGTGGYKGAGIIVTQPVGDCGSITVGYEQQSGGARRSRR